VALACAFAGLLAAACARVDLQPVGLEPAAAGGAAEVVSTTSSAAGAGGFGGSGGAPPATSCKRGVASTSPPPALLAPTASQPGVGWWYDFTWQAASRPAHVEFVPMIWGDADLNALVPVGSRFLLGFEEPDSAAHSNLTLEEAAQSWPGVEAIARHADAFLVAPSLSSCGADGDGTPCSDPAVDGPYAWLERFQALCPRCRFDYVAVDSQACDVAALAALVDGGAADAGVAAFQRPVWITKLACPASASVEDQRAYMEAAIPYLEANASVFRYAWFDDASIPNARLEDDGGALTALGEAYATLASPSCD
jgi:hypothetical protein